MFVLKKAQKKIKIFKYLLLLIVISIAILVLFSLIFQDQEISEELTKIPEQKNKNTLKDDCSLSINSSILEGINNELPYRIKAKNISKDRSNNYILDKVSCIYSANHGDIIIDSEKGFLDEVARQLFLNNKVNVMFNGMHLKSSHLHLDIITNDIKSDKPTTIDYKNSYIKANQVQTKNADQTIKFKGGVKTIFDINDF